MLTDSLRQVVSVDTVRRTPLNDELLLNGRVAFDAGQVAQVYPIFGGTVTQVVVEAGDYVKKGDLLAVIRSSEVADFEKQQKDAVRRLALADRNLEAVRDMLGSGTASERDLLQAEQEAADAKAEVKRLREVYDIYRIGSNSTYDIISPVSGFVVGKNISRYADPLRPGRGVVYHLRFGQCLGDGGCVRRRYPQSTGRSTCPYHDACLREGQGVCRDDRQGL